MDLLEYDYLERTTENPDPPKIEKRERADPNRSHDHRRGDEKEEIRENRSRKVGRGGEDSERRREYGGQDRGSNRHYENDRSRSGREYHERRARDVDREHRGEKEKDRGERSGRDRAERDEGKDRTRERHRDGERERVKGRERVRSHGENDGGQEMEMEGSGKDREARERESEGQPQHRDNRRFKEKKEGEEPEADPERDQRTVFAYQMPLKANEKDVYDFFSKAGKVRDVRVIMDRNSRRSKGVGYVEFYDSMSVPMAIALSGQLLLGQPVMVKPSEAEKNLVQSTSTAGGSGGLTGQYSPAARKLYVGNLHFNMTEDQLRQVFEPFGPVEIVQLPLDLETGQCKGFGFVQFVQLEHAKAAQSLNGKLDIAGRIIKVSAVTDHVGIQETGANTIDFDDEDGGGMASLNARSRAMLMQKLDRTGIASSIAGSLGASVLNGSTPNHYAPSLPFHGQPGVPASVLQTMAVAPKVVESIGVPSECVLLKNMFDPNEEMDPSFDCDIKEEVQEECSTFGLVKHIHVEKNSTGYVYLRFEAVASAVAAQRALHGRWYAGRTISATFMLPHEYEAKARGGV